MGLWGPVCAAIHAQDPTFEKNRDFGRDLFNLAIGLVRQVAMVACPMCLVIQKSDRALLAFGCFVATSLILKFTSYDKLRPGEMYMTPDGNAPKEKG